MEPKLRSTGISKEAASSNSSSSAPIACHPDQQATPVLGDVRQVTRPAREPGLPALSVNNGTVPACLAGVITKRQENLDTDTRRVWGHRPDGLWSLGVRAGPGDVRSRPVPYGDRHPARRRCQGLGCRMAKIERHRPNRQVEAAVQTQPARPSRVQIASSRECVGRQASGRRIGSDGQLLSRSLRDRDNCISNAIVSSVGLSDLSPNRPQMA